MQILPSSTGGTPDCPDDEAVEGRPDAGAAANCDDRGAEIRDNPWQRLGSEPGPDLRLFRLRHDMMRHPRSGEVLERLVLETPHWVNVVARTVEGMFVIVHQYRFGAEAVTLEIPGGVVDPGEDHRDSAERELREETGFTTRDWSYLGSVLPNPAYQDNLCHHYMADNVELTHAQALDPGEDIVVGLYSADEMRSMVLGGVISHSLTLTALSRVLDLRSDESKEDLP